MFNWDKVFSRRNWQNKPSQNTPLSANNLNAGDYAVNELDNRVIELDKSKLDVATANTMVKDVTLDESTGVFTVTKLNGTTFIVDTKLEKIATNWTYNKDTQQIVLTLDDGTKEYIDLSTLVTQYEFLDSDTIGFQVQPNGKIKAIVIDGSITENKLQSNYLADVTVQAQNALGSANSAASSADAAAYDAKLSQSYAVGGSGIRDGENTDNAKYYKEQAQNSSDSASSSASSALASSQTATTKASEAATSSANAAQSEINAKSSETAAKTSETNAKNSEINSFNSASEAAQSETNSENNANLSKSYSVGTDGVTRPNDNVDCAKYYYEQARQISEGLSGGLLPMGTITFSQLASQTKVKGYMYNISDEFVTDETFKEGAGLTVPAGSNVYWTTDGYWDILAGSPVTGIKGDNETIFRRGNVNITKDNIGLGNVPDVTTNNQTPTYTVSTTLTNLKSGEILSVAFGKIAKAVTDLISHLADTVKHITSSERTKWNNAVDNVETHTEQLSALRNTGVITDTTDWLSIPSGHYLVQYENPISADYNGPVGAYQLGNAFVVKNTINNHNSGFILYIENNAHPKIWYREYWDSWRDWESATPQSYTDRYKAGGIIDLISYTPDNMFTFPSDGYLTITVSTDAAQWVNVRIVTGGSDLYMAACTPANETNSITQYQTMYVKKGMQMYIGSIHEASSGGVQVWFNSLIY